MHWGLSAFAAAKIIHVVFATAWVGMSLLMNLVLMPTLAQATPSTRREFGGRLIPQSIKYSNIVGGLLLVSGLALVYIQRDGFQFSGNAGRLLAFGLVANLALLYLLNYALRPTAVALAKVQAGLDPQAPPPSSVIFLMRRMTWVSRMMLVIVLLALVAMVVANVAPG